MEPLILYVLNDILLIDHNILIPSLRYTFYSLLIIINWIQIF